jgi:adenylate cyclase
VPALKLISTIGDQTFEVPTPGMLTVGRAVTSDVPVYDPTVSRNHAEIHGTEQVVTVKDLGSSNGTFVNGNRISEETICHGDVVTFGKVAFKVREVTLAQAVAPKDAGDRSFPGTQPEATIVRQLPVRESGGFAQPTVEPSGTSYLKVAGESEHERQAMKLSLLLEISKELAKQQDVDRLLEKVVDITFQVMDVDRVSILMVEGNAGDLAPRTSKTKLGDLDAGRHVPRSIASRCVNERLAILTDNAAADERFKGKSILMQSVRSAMCTPLMGSEGSVLGILYVDNLTATNSFGDEDLEFLIAFSSIAAVAIENSELINRIAREAVVLANFQRYFAPDLAQQIVGQDGVVQLGGTKRPVVVFFSDIRGFTSLSEQMSPDDIASLLTEYFTEMVEILFEHDGTLDKFMGDAIMALWGAPRST